MNLKPNEVDGAVENLIEWLNYCESTGVADLPYDFWADGSDCLTPRALVGILLAMINRADPDLNSVKENILLLAVKYPDAFKEWAGERMFELEN